MIEVRYMNDNKMVIVSGELLGNGYSYDPDTKTVNIYLSKRHPLSGGYSNSTEETHNNVEKER